MRLRNKAVGLLPNPGPTCPCGGAGLTFALFSQGPQAPPQPPPPEGRHPLTQAQVQGRLGSSAGATCVASLGKAAGLLCGPGRRTGLARWRVCRALQSHSGARSKRKPAYPCVHTCTRQNSLPCLEPSGKHQHKAPLSKHMTKDEACGPDLFAHRCQRSQGMAPLHARAGPGKKQRAAFIENFHTSGRLAGPVGGACDS